MANYEGEPVDSIPLYVSSDGKEITDWQGGFIGSVRSSARIRLPLWSSVHGQYITAYVAVINGIRYYGRSSPGICINLHPYKNQKEGA